MSCLLLAAGTLFLSPSLGWRGGLQLIWRQQYQLLGNVVLGVSFRQVVVISEDRALQWGYQNVAALCVEKQNIL